MKQDLLFDLKLYIKRILSYDIGLIKKKDISIVPLYLQEIFKFYKLKLYGKEIVAAVYISDEFLHSPVKIRKFVNILSDKFNKDVVFVSRRVSSWNRDRLIKQNVPFIIPKNQMFLPHLGIDLREYFIKKKVQVKAFSPSTQSIIFNLLINGFTNGITPDDIFKRSEYSRMTISRVINELETLGIANVRLHGRESFVNIKYSGKELWESILPYSKNPIKKILYLNKYDNRFDEHLYRSGFSALSEHTKISRSDIPEYAIGKSLFNRFCKKGYLCSKVKFPEEAKIKLELWSYLPEMVGDKTKKNVDSLSLYKCFDETDDVRVLQALDELIRGIKW